jgi:hypothetical protein
MAQTMMMDLGHKTWPAIRAPHDSGPWYRYANPTKGLPMASHMPTGGFYSGLGAVLSHSYSQQFVTAPKNSTIPGYWQGGGSAGGTQVGQALRSNGYSGFGDIAADIAKLSDTYNQQVAAGNTSGAAATKTALDALKKQAEAEKGTDWMSVLTKALEAGTTIYATEMARAEATRARRRARAAGTTGVVQTQIPNTGGAPMPTGAPPKTNWALWGGVAAVAAVVGYMALR